MNPKTAVSVLFLILTLLLAGGCERSAGTTTAVCGDGTAEQHEECDGSDLDGETCSSLGLQSGELACAGDCTFDTRNCTGTQRCGNNTREYPEDCDGWDLAGQTCESLGLGPGDLGCDGQCNFDVSACINSGPCGNGVQEQGEECDGQDLGGMTCEALGFFGGQLACAADCTFDISNCQGDILCGDGFVDFPTEECEETDMNGNTCRTLLYLSGYLLCSDICLLDDTWCTNNQCENRFDDNGNGWVDCDDPKCSGRFGCPVEVCGDGVDNDGNGMTDCSDVACMANAPACNGGCLIHENQFFGLCHNGQDDDCDGQADANDPDCQADTAIKLVHDMNGGPVQAGDMLMYSITIYAENGPILGGTIEDVMDNAFSSVEPLDGGVYDPMTRSVTWTVTSVPQFQTFTVHVVVTIDLQTPPGTLICNQATVDLGPFLLTDNPDAPGPDNETCVNVVN